MDVLAISRLVLCAIMSLRGRQYHLGDRGIKAVGVVVHHEMTAFPDLNGLDAAETRQHIDSCIPLAVQVGLSAVQSLEPVHQSPAVGPGHKRFAAFVECDV